jgi:Concanavalin A-like lectin/glucanases superfamily
MKLPWTILIGAAFISATLQGHAQAEGPGTALLLNGTNGFATVTNAVVFNFTNAFTVEAWINTTNLNLDWQAIVTKGDSAWRLHRYGTSHVISFGTSGLGAVDTYGATPVDDGNWHHVAGVYDGAGNKYLYVDGALDGFNNTSGTAGTNDYPLDIGENAEQTNRIWNGQIDEVRIWNIARSQEQIQASMHRSLAGTETGLVAYYRLDETAGTSITNSVPGGSALNGSLVGDAAFVSSTAPIGLPVPTIGAATPQAGNRASVGGTIIPNFQPTGYYFQYGLSTAYGMTTPISVIAANADGGNAPVPVNQTLSGLMPAEPYHFRLVATNGAGASVSADQVFANPAAVILIDVNFTFGAGTNFPQTGAAVLGVAGDSWNNLNATAPASTATFSNIVDSTGTIVPGVTVGYANISAGNDDTNGTPMDPGTANLMRGYLFGSGYYPFNVLITGLSAYAGASCDLVAYSAGDRYEQSSFLQLFSGSSTGSWVQNIDGPGITLCNDRRISGGLGDAYDTYNGALDGTTLDLDVGYWGSSYSILNGIQLQITIPYVPPVLSIANSNGAVVLSWPASAAGFHVEYTTSLWEQPNWQTLAGAATNTGPTYVQRVPASLGNAAFFRLSFSNP